MSKNNGLHIPRGFRPMNRIVIGLQKLGLRMGNTFTVLTVVGRKSGQPRTTPVTQFTYQGNQYILGGFPGAAWVRNVRAADTAVLANGRRKRTVRLIELPAEDSKPILRAFPQLVPAGVRIMIKAGVVREGTPAEFEALAGRTPVFRVQPVD
ncbi:nitroreductase family deazaflavin-dependent oxidoreductase [Nocardia iowensis]|uniref:Nitroreductase family deazaflavin-dependent oxidoreductase n=1 Tax=Nocardia iowensis TaxID=204891 RepID=A0ABX8S1M4_NOCIO|nr:nitroreductase family deazaflavin-dependent oxidoreductase [Nocardia iowensis]QXN95411.1 nitroreductase family deazaflavin-dependent oxidoreductase [Nocardia iowensis]